MLKVNFAQAVFQAVFLAALALAGVAPANAAPLPRAGVTYQEMETYLKSRGLKAEQAKNSDNLDILEVSGDINWEVYFYKCDEVAPVRCREIQFVAGWTGTYTPELANAMDRDWRFLRTYTSKDNESIFVEYDLLLTKNEAYEDLGEHLDNWLDKMGHFPQRLADKQE